MPTDKMLVLFCRELTGGIRKHIVAIMESYKGSEDQLRLVTNMGQADSSFHKFLNENPEFQSCIMDLPISRSPSPKDFFQMLSLYRELKKLDAKLVFHGHGAKGGVMARLLGHYMRAKVIYTPHGGSIHPMFGPVKNMIYAIIEKALYPLTDHLVFESEYSLRAYAERIHSESEKFKLNLNGVVFQHLDIAAREYSNDFVVGAFGALRSLKGFDLLIEAAAKADNPRLKVKIFGEGPERKSLQNKIDELNAPVELMGETVRSLEEMKACDLIVQPSRFESFGLTALEAISVGTPVLVSNAGGLGEIVQDMETGRVFESGNSNSLADRIQWSMENEAELTRMSQEAHRVSQRRFNQDKMLSELYQIYHAH